MNDSTVRPNIAMVSASETGLARPARGRPRHLRHDAGSPLLEMITSNGMRAFGVITVLGLIGVAWATLRGSDFITDLVTLGSVVRTANPSGYGTGALSSAPYLASERIPSKLKNGTTNLQNMWGGATTLTGNGQTVFIDTVGVPKSDCIGELPKVPNDVVSVRVASTAEGLPAATALAMNPGITADVAYAACANASNAIRFEFR
ncbi:MAG: hypothetical protein KAY22_04460 [Rhizorhabdus sp.]|uniref:type 4 pilus major pilin n=1 Tax=Rhizorhabdus sp. TaxID=1968843 RepID=UPI001B647065|nr:type 4 pilus major pilin [Rhizorhabdus sp.]MBP8231537.1 hypothetical protein [Rhizorhabdus sp.]